MDNKKILITGGAGYVGCVVVKKLLAKGYKVKVLDSMLDYNGKKTLEENKNLEVVNGDIRHLEDLYIAIHDVYAVLHLAGIVGDPACNVDFTATITVNHEATKSLVEICKRFNVKRLIFASSCSVYGASKDIILNEGSFLNPISSYAKTQIDSEQIILDSIGSDIVPTMLRFGTVYGMSDRMRFDLVVNILTAKAVMEGAMTVFHGETWRPMIHVDDAANSYITVLEAPDELVNREIFNVGSNSQNYQMIELGRLVEQAIPGSQLEQVSINEDERNYRVSFDKISNLLGYKTEKTVLDGIKEIADSLRNGKIKNYKDDIYYNVHLMEYK
jgi:nucleoside-diphosphate-sugar epimerase